MENNSKQNSGNNSNNKLQFKTKDFLEMNPTRYFAVVEDKNLVKKVSYYHAALDGFNTKDVKTVEVPAELVNSLNEFFEALTMHSKNFHCLKERFVVLPQSLSNM